MEQERKLVRMYEKSTKNLIREFNKNIDLLYWELDYLNNNLSFYNNKRPDSIYFNEKFKHINPIRERIPDIYKEINYYKECINAEKKEMNRIYNYYGYYDDYYDYDEEDLEDDTDEYVAEYLPHKEVNFDELEEIKDYKFNPLTGCFE